MALRDEQHHQSPRDVPTVGRPRGAVWRSLQADGVVWEGQVLLVGDDVDLAARMIVTHRRVVFVRGGDVVLDIPRAWLRQEPVMRRGGVLDIFVTAPGSNVFDEPMTVSIRMREGHPAAGHIIAMLAPGGARRISPDALSGMERAREAAPAPRFGGFWDEEAEHDAAASEPLVARPREADAAAEEFPDWVSVEPSDHVLRIPSSPPPRPSPAAFPIAGMVPKSQRRSPWGLLLRICALMLLLATAAALGAGRLGVPIPGQGFEAILAAPTPTPAVPGSTAETQPAVALSPDEQTAIAVGVGGAEPETPAPDAAAATENEPLAKTPKPQTDAETPVPAAATEPPIPTPAATDTPPPAPTRTPTPVVAPVVATPVEPEDTTAGTPAAGAAPGASLSQPAAFATDVAPAQEIVVGPIRVAIATALRAETLPKYGLPPNGGEWVLLVGELANTGESPASIAMSDFRLFDRGTGQVADLDSGTDVIASLAGFDPAFASTDVIAVEPGQPVKALLLYFLPDASDELALLVAQSSIDLAPSLATGQADAANVPDLIPAKVAAVLDGSRITVDIDGQRYQVQYLGVQAPAAGACFAPEAAAVNSQLVEGKQVWLERQATERGADDVLLRDVWIEGANGERSLVAARLLEAGAVTPAPAAPDTRYQAWLAASADLARDNGAGLWSACPEVAPASAMAAPPEITRLAFMTSAWRVLQSGSPR